MKLDPNKTWRLVEERFNQETDPKIKRNLELVLEHMQAEARGDIEGVVATLTETPLYKTHQSPDNELTNPSGSKDAIRAFYDLTIVQTGAHQIEFDVDRVVADHDSVMTEGLMKMAYPGRTLAAMGMQDLDVDAFYLYETRMCIVWPADPETGFLTGEEVYGGDGMAGIGDRKITQADIAPLLI